MEYPDIELASNKKEPQTEGQLTVDVFQDEDNIIIQSTVAGVGPDQIDISITNEMVTIRGQRAPEEKVRPSDYFHQELYWGAFSRSIILPVDIDADSAKATMKNGILTIKLPKLTAGPKTKKVSVSD